MIRRTFDPAFLNDVANHPAVRPSLAGSGIIDLGPVVSNANNFALRCDHGGFVLTLTEPGRYEVHSLFLPDSGGVPIAAMRAAQEWMFTRTDCHTITSKVPASNRAAKGFALAGGLKTIFRRQDAALGTCEYVELDVMRWAMGNAALEDEGEAFHQFLAASKAASGSALPVHDHDEAHERAVGAAFLMIRRGQPLKGAAFYNRWARLAGYADIEIVSLSPLAVDVRDAVLGLSENGLEVLLCR